VLTDRPDTRLLLSSPLEPFSSRGAYRVMNNCGVPMDAMRIWAMLLPMKVNFFAWLLHRGRLNTRAYLHYWNIRALEDSWCVHYSGILETDAHIFAGCHKAHDVWECLGMSLHGDLVQRPWDIGVGVTLPDAIRVDFFLLLLWHIWKARNSMIFYQLDSTPHAVLRRVAFGS